MYFKSKCYVDCGVYYLHIRGSRVLYLKLFLTIIENLTVH